MIGMMMLTFILFFAFVVNTGMLVNAKINLQNAADMAAYAGAATQARLLNQISFLNYEMRRQYKKFLFRYYVMGSMAQDPFPRSSSGGQGKTPPVWSPDGKAIYGVPAVCMIFNSSDNFCHLPSLPKISIPPSNPLDAINSTLISQLQSIELIRQNNCLSIAYTNTTTLRLWLWNSDPDLTNLQQGAPPALQKAINTIRGLALGIGLLPREVLLRSRIETLKGYVNEPAQTNVTVDSASQLLSGDDPNAVERTIEAFYSAFYTLGENTFESGGVVMDELTPDALIVLNDIKIKFDAYAVGLNMSGSMTASQQASDCTPQVENDTIQSPFPIGVVKDPKTLTYYAIRLKAKAHVLFSPFGDVTLKAYSAAQPFGSRIGPPIDETGFLRPAESTGALQPPPGSNNFNFALKIPNLPIREQGDSAGQGNGWDTQEALAAFYNGFKGVGQNGNMQSIDQDAINRALMTAMAPNPYEGNKYNIPTDMTIDPFVHYFDTHGVLAFWAPIFPPSKASQADSEIQSLVQSLMGDTRVDSAAFKQALTLELTNYVSALKKGQGEPIGGAAEDFNIAYIQDSQHLPGSPPTLINAQGGLTLTDPNKIKTSWNSVLNGDFRQAGRVGYSVKFVSFPSLLGHTSPTNGSDTWSNSLNADGEANLDLSFIQH